MNKEEKAVALFYEGYNCAQAVFCAFADEMGIDLSCARALSSSFGGGMGRLRQVCGTLSGAVMALGFFFGGYDPADGAAKAVHYARVREIAARFEREVGSIVCAEILRAHGQDPAPGGTPGERTAEFYRKRKVCVDNVALAARLLEEYLNEHEEERTDRHDH